LTKIISKDLCENGGAMCIEKITVEEGLIVGWISEKVWTGGP
jgi:hypothetical protein